MSDFDRPEFISTEELIEMLRGYSVGLEGSGNVAGAIIVRIAADRLEEQGKRLDEYYKHC